MTHGFDYAISMVKNAGARATRKGWNGKGQFIELAKNVTFTNPNTGRLVTTAHDAIAFYGTSGIQVGWLASQTDMLADDWIILELE